MDADYHEDFQDHEWSLATWNHLILQCFCQLGVRLFEEIHFMEQFFIKMQSIFSFTCQMIYFILCDFVLNESSLGDDIDRTNKTVVTALTTVLFYAVFGYFAAKVRDLFLKSRIPRAITNSSLSCIKWILKLVLEWAKAVIVVLCIKEQGIQYGPKPAYTALTLSYYLCSEKIFCEIFAALVENILNLEYFESLEYLYVPLILNVYTIAAGFIINTYLLMFSYSTFVLTAFYFIVFLRIKDAYCNYWQLIVAERKTYSSFRVATEKEIADRDDICAVCLNKMSKARITPCNHLFHPSCLKQCLKSSFLCPLCKYNFRENQ